MVWNLEEVAVKLFMHFYNDILMILNFHEAAVKLNNPNEIFVF